MKYIFPQNEAKEEQKGCNFYILKKTTKKQDILQDILDPFKKGFGQVTNQVLFAHVIHFKIFKPIARMFLILIYTGIVIW